MAQHLVGLAQKPLFQVILYVQKACDSLDMEWCLEILRRYGLGQKLARILENYCRRQRIITKVG